MPSVESNFKELMRRGFFWNKNITLDDGHTSLTFDGNPNDASETGIDGEKKIYSLLPGATFFQSTGEWWLKVGSPNNWERINVGESGQNNETCDIPYEYIKFIGYIEYSYNNAGELIDIFKYVDDTKNDLKFRKTFFYDQNFNLIKTQIFKYSTNETFTTFFYYDNDGSLIKKETYKN